MPFQDFENLPIKWSDHEDIAIKLYEKFGDEFGESKIYRIRFTQLLDWILEIPLFCWNKRRIDGRSFRTDSSKMGL